MSAVNPVETGSLAESIAAARQTKLIACNHCGIVALNTPAFGWRRYWDEDGELAHHCPAAVQYNEWIAQGLVHMMAPDEAVIYEDIDRWVDASLVGAHDD